MFESRKTLRRRLKALHRNLRGASMAARAFASTDHPLLAHIIPVRRCNLACTYCNEFDDCSKPVPTEEMLRRIYHEMKALEKQSFTRVNAFQDNIAQGLPNDWRCRAGARYLYICEDGLVHYCSQQRGYPGVPLAKYTRDDMRREYLTEKSCAPHCTVSCVHQVSVFDNWRAPQHPTPMSPSVEELVQLK